MYYICICTTIFEKNFVSKNRKISYNVKHRKDMQILWNILLIFLLRSLKNKNKLYYNDANIHLCFYSKYELSEIYHYFNHN